MGWGEAGSSGRWAGGTQVGMSLVRKGGLPPLLLFEWKMKNKEWKIFHISFHISHFPLKSKSGGKPPFPTQRHSHLSAFGLLPTALLTAVVVFYFCDVGEWDLDDLAVCTLDLDARGGEGLSGFHATNDTADTPPVARDDLNVVFAI